VNSKEKNRIAECIRRDLTQRLREHGFARSRPTFWVRSRDHVFEFIHLHLYSFAPAFRAHLGIRVQNDDFDAPALNGPDSGESWRDGKPLYDLALSEVESSITRCAEEIARYCSEVGEPWFSRSANPKALLADGSPLSDAARSHLATSLEGNPSAEAIRLSRRLLGVS
jgi:hypothetical protein